MNMVVLADSPAEVNNRLNALPAFFRESGFMRGMTPRDLIAYFQPIIDSGANYLCVASSSMDLSTVRLFAEKVMPELQDYYASRASQAAGAN